MALADLPKEMQDNFDRRLKELGMNPSHVIPVIRTADREGPTRLSADPAISHYPPHKLTISDLDHLKRLTGIPNEHFQNGVIEEHHPVPPAWDSTLNDRMPEDLTPEQNNNIVKAMVAYVWGDSSKVTSYKSIIEKHHLPMDIATFAVRDVIVSPAKPLQIGPGNLGNNFGTVTVEPGGQIIVGSDSEATIQQLVSQ